MPCSDVTERIQLNLDPLDRLVSYQLNKRTCGRGVGADSLLAERFQGSSVEELLALDPSALFAEFEQTYPEEAVAFLHLKHVVAVQTALAAFSGRESCTKEDTCTIAEVSYGPDGTYLDADIAVDVATKKIKSCCASGGGGCGI